MELKLGVISRSRKENEWRLPIHPRHFERIDDDLRRRIYLERGYGERFGVSDRDLSPYVAGVNDRDRLFAECDVILLPKLQAQDLAELRAGQTAWGWPHCVQDEQLTQVAVDRRQTLIAWEAMNHWTPDGGFSLHVFHQNNEMAGYCSVLHTLEIVGSTGVYGRRMTAAVIGFGATARGAVTALDSHGVHDVCVLTSRPIQAVSAPIHSARIRRLVRDGSADGELSVATDGGRVPVAEFLAQHDIVINCTLQDPNAPMMFLREDDLRSFRPGSLIIDVSCDEGMGFDWARPTSFKQPTFVVGDNICYYAVDHSPSYLWNSATWVISQALLPYLRPVLAGPDAWDADETIRRAIEIRDGIIQNPAILTFQGRGPGYPHAKL
ncbi:MAG: N(5)-(carboxyethyl)ornithine synthase [Nocardioidaceae bacterium]